MKIMLCILFALAVTAGIVAGDEYSHKYSTFEISFVTLPGDTANVLWGDGGANNGTLNMTSDLITVNLNTGESLFVIPHNLSTWEGRDTSENNLVRLWSHDADGNLYSVPTITRLGNGDYLVTGHMMRASTYITRTFRSFDFDHDGMIDFYVLWNEDGKADTDMMNYLAANTNVFLPGA